MINSLLKASTLFLLLVAIQTSPAICQEAQLSKSNDGERLVVLPFEIRGLTTDEGLQLRQRFCETLAASKRFDVIPDNVLRNNLELGGLSKIDSCNTLPCLAQLGKVLNVEKIVHVSVDRWKERFVMHIRLVRSSDAALLYDERVDFSGDFNNFRSIVAPEQARKLSVAYLDRRPNWYLIAAAVLAGVGLIYWIYRHLHRQVRPKADPQILRRRHSRVRS
jgi:hypothetical protein